MLGSLDARVSARSSSTAMPDTEHAACVYILLSTYNGARYLRPQLESLLAQIHRNWVLYWRDDGSTDETAALLSNFISCAGPHRCVRIAEPIGRVWPTASFLALLRAAVRSMDVSDVVAFADQDDVWFPDKLARGLAAVATYDVRTAVLYCGRLLVVDAQLRRLGETAINPARCGFPAALTQNIAGGSTILMNSEAAALVARSVPPTTAWHDWWCYLLVSAAGGRIIVDQVPVALYRQHGGNFIGIPASRARRALAALRRGPYKFMDIMRGHLEALSRHPDLADSARPMVMQLMRASQGGLRLRLAALGLAGLCRQTWYETLLFRIWFLLG